MRFLLYVLLYICFEAAQIKCFADWSEDKHAEKWYHDARKTLHHNLNIRYNKNIAKNLILFVGDGMGVSTVTAGRIYKGQLKNRNGEEERTYMEKLDHSAFVKTYNIDAQTSDSAGTATAYLSGVKTRIGLIGVDGHAIYGDCKSSLNSHVDSIAKWAHDAGKSVGIVTNVRITHATPSAMYAHSPSRDWEAYDGTFFGHKEHLEGCKDIAEQLIDKSHHFNVYLFKFF